MKTEQDNLPAANAESETEQPDQFSPIAHVREKLNGTEWQQLTTFLQKQIDYARAEGATQAHTEAKTEMEDALKLEREDMRRTHICIPAHASTVELFNFHIDRRIESARYPEETANDIVMKLFAAINTADELD